MNTKLLNEKKNLENLIKDLNNRIVQEKKKLNTADYNGKKNCNIRDKHMDAYNEAHLKELRLEEQIAMTKQ